MKDNFYHAPGAPVESNTDYLVHATALKGQIRAIGIRSTLLCQEALRLHGISPVTTAALGRFMTGSLLLAEDMKNDADNQTTVIICDGPIGGMTVVCDANGNVRGYANQPVVENFYHAPGKLDVGKAIGNGILRVIRGGENRTQPYIGTVELQSGEIAEDFTYYLASSEQIPSIVCLGVLLENEKVSVAGGFMVQVLPGADAETLAYLEERAGGGFPDVTFLLKEGMNPEKILDVFLADPEIKFLSSRLVQYKCPCSRYKMEKNLIALGRSELRSIQTEENEITLECHFCDSRYKFTRDQISDLLEQLT